MSDVVSAALISGAVIMLGAIYSSWNNRRITKMTAAKVELDVSDNYNDQLKDQILSLKTFIIEQKNKLNYVKRLQI